MKCAAENQLVRILTIVTFHRWSNAIEILANQTADLCQAIKRIKGGRAERAIELLGAGLDGCIIGLGRLKKKGEFLIK
jgi:hypothetical protein